MNTKERLDQLMTAIEILPPIDLWDELGLTPDNLVFPNGTEGITEEIAKALICFMVREGEETANKVAILAHNSAHLNHERDLEPTESDLQSLALAVNAGWLTSNFAPIVNSFNIIEQIIMTTDLTIPPLATAILMPPQVADGLKEKEPYDLLEGKDND